MIRDFKFIVDDFRRGENLDLYSTIVVAIIVAGLGVVGVVKFEIISAAILATLSLLAISLLAGRRTMDELRRASSQLISEFEVLQKEVQGAGRVSSILLEAYPDLSEEFQSASRISVLGTSLSSTVGHHYPDLEQALKRGCRLRILTVDPTPEIIALLAYKSYWAHEPDVMKRNWSANLSRAIELGKVLSEPELFELRTIPYIPSCGMVLLEREDGASKIYVKVMGFRRKHTACFEVNDQVDDDWFEVFFGQFEELWKASTTLP